MQTLFQEWIWIYIDPYGNALVNEKWKANLTEGTEGYKQYYNIGKSSISDFTMTSDLGNYTFTDNWDVDGSFSDKRFKNGFNYSNGGVELCFGITEYGNRTYNLKYKINNFIYKTKDGYQMLYWELISKKLNPKPKNSYIKIHADNHFSDSLDVWGFGNYGGKAYVHNGYIEASSKEGGLGSNEYITLLVKFPKDTFNINTVPLDKTFDEYLQMANEESTTYKKSFFDSWIFLLEMGIAFLIIFLFVKKTKIKKQYSGNMKIDFGENGINLTNKYPYFRKIPCNKNIYEAYWIATQYKINDKKEDFFGAILLKWIKNGNVVIKKEYDGVTNKNEKSSIIFKNSANIFFQSEKKLYNMMYKVSKDGILEQNEFKNWCNNNCIKIFDWFNEVIDAETFELSKEGKCKFSSTPKVFKGQSYKANVYYVDESLKDEAEQLDGLKRFFNDFTTMNEKQPIEVNLWEEYLMFAQILGMADKVAKEFKKLYPNQISYLSVDDVIFINNISMSVAAATIVAQNMVESYSSGGGGFSSGGGGGGFR